MTLRENFWAPEIFHHDGRYYLIFSCKDKATKVHSLYIAVGYSPSGKFTDLLDGDPIYSPGYSVIDAHLFRDDDGEIYLFYSRDCSQNIVGSYKLSETYVIKMKKDLTGTVGSPVLVSSPSASYEILSGSTRWNEGPCCIKRNGIYYVIYSCNFYQTPNYLLAYSTATNIMGPYKKADNNPILQSSNTVKGTGHNSIFFSPDGTEIFTAYHILTNGKNTDAGRSPCFDKIVFDDEGNLYIEGPSDFKMPLPSGTSGLYTLSRDCISLISTTHPDGEKVFSKLTNSISSLSTNKERIKLDAYTVELGLSGGNDITTIWVYPSYKGYMTKSTFDILINGKYKISGLSFYGLNQKEPVAVSLSDLPDGVTVETVAITGNLAEGETSLELSEISFTYKK